MTAYLATEKEWDEFAGTLLKSAKLGEAAGLDTEYYCPDGRDPRERSCVGVTRVHIWSVARFSSSAIGPRGFRPAVAYVLPAAALEHRGIRQWLEDSACVKAVHNQGVDDHSLFNHGVTIAGAVNTLSLARWVWPRRNPTDGGRGWGLDALGEDLLGVGKTESYKELFREEVEETRTTYRKVKLCECGVTPCRKRQTQVDAFGTHRRFESRVATGHMKKVWKPVPLQTVVPGHPLWERAVEYAARDAKLALEIYDLATRKQKQRPSPWT